MYLGNFDQIRYEVESLSVNQTTKVQNSALQWHLTVKDAVSAKFRHENLFLDLTKIFDERPYIPHSFCKNQPLRECVIQGSDCLTIIELEKYRWPNFAENFDLYCLHERKILVHKSSLASTSICRQHCLLLSMHLRHVPSMKQENRAHGNRKYTLNLMNKFVSFQIKLMTVFLIKTNLLIKPIIINDL